MSLEHAILGFLSYEPMSGYDLKAMFDHSVKHFWPADQSQIYRTLGRIAERGWAEVEVIEQENRPDRKVYRLTDDGHEELRRWLAAPLPAAGERIPELVQVFFAGQLSDEEAMALFERMAERTRAVREQLDHTPEACAGESRWDRLSPRETFFAHLTLEYGQMMTRASLEWIESVMERLREGAQERGDGK